MRAGAGAVRLAGGDAASRASRPTSSLKTEPLAELLADERTGAVLVGPGLGRDGTARERLAEALAADRPTVVDADALALLDRAQVGDHRGAADPHAARRRARARSPKASASRPRASSTAPARWPRRPSAVVVAKGPDTVDRRARRPHRARAVAELAGCRSPAPATCSPGIVASRLAATGDPFAAACEAVWLHGEAARLAGPAFTASELARHVAQGLRRRAVSHPKRSSASPPRATASPRRAAMRRSPRPATCCCADGTLQPGPHHADAAVPPFRHAAAAASCSTSTRRRWPTSSRDRVLNAAEGQGLVPETRRAGAPLAAAHPPPRDAARGQRRRAAADRLQRGRLAPGGRHARMPRARARAVRAGRAAARAARRRAATATRSRSRWR